ncbi:MAG TPA: glutaredoxin family protein, partial [Anaerolineales bacterium]|nr:glutaredoxin family protein [Anaerolineales bacterium]
MVNLTLYTRKNCQLCDELKADLESLQETHPHRLVEIDIDSDSTFIATYGETIPVVEAGPYILYAPISRKDLAMTIGAAIDRQEQLEKVGDDLYKKRALQGKKMTGA